MPIASELCAGQFIAGDLRVESLVLAHCALCANDDLLALPVRTMRERAGKAVKNAAAKIKPRRRFDPSRVGSIAALFSLVFMSNARGLIECAQLAVAAAG